MPGILVVLFWTWLAVSVCVYLYRLFTNGSVRPKTDSDSTNQASEDGPDRLAAFEQKLATESVEPVEVEAPIEESRDNPDSDGVEPEESKEPDDLEEPADITTAPTLDIDEPLARPTLSGVLEGIQMPADLVPTNADQASALQMQFVTTTHAPAAVGASLADELERLGFTLSPLTETSIEASKPEALVEVRILPDQTSIESALGNGAQAIPPEAVVVDFRLR